MRGMPATGTKRSLENRNLGVDVGPLLPFTPDPIRTGSNTDPFFKNLQTNAGRGMPATANTPAGVGGSGNLVNMPYQAVKGTVPIDVMRSLNRIILDRQRAFDIAKGLESSGTKDAADAYDRESRAINRWSFLTNRDAAASFGGRGLAKSPASMQRAKANIRLQENARNDAAAQVQTNALARLLAAKELAKGNLDTAYRDKVDTTSLYEGSAENIMGSF